MGRMRSFLLAAALSATLFLLTAANDRTPAVYVFGDSSVDVGNNNYLPGNLGKVNFRPNGIDYPGGKPTGRFSNGYNVADFLAMKVGLKKSPPAYLSLTSDAQMHGVNFASGGSGILNATGRNISISLNQQIKDYEEITRHLKSRVGATAADRFLSKSLFIFSTGNNDMLGFYTVFGLKNATQQDLLIGQLANQFKNQLQTLYNLGARKFVVFGASRLGCVPTLRRAIPSGECAEDLNKLSQQFNKATEAVLHSLASTLKGFSYSFIKVYDIISVVSSNPTKYGFTDLVSACCGSGKFNAESSCTPNATYCSNRDQYFYWDRLHPTQATSRLISNTAFRGRKYTTPVTVEQLADSRRRY
ncbi:unnamed protein product [Spirodela intermedia]|uniref:Uncharacterized protein n=1 Tax=Spirodela intermedia TaxID=51605 RepID=A0A7I8IGS6_SPIIN|nr:unnamed protein product [Spirodela intermedia]CAA6656062.1 unnamed protein product [Spirodela intermedia]